MLNPLTKIRKGDRVFFKPEFSNPGEENKIMLAMEDEIDGATSIPVCTPCRDMIFTPWRREPLECIDRKTPSEQMAERTKLHIVRDVVKKIVPLTVASFSELHNYVDANCYGESEAILEELGGDLDAISDTMNASMEIINAWLKSGGLLDFLRMVGEQ